MIRLKGYRDSHYILRIKIVLLKGFGNEINVIIFKFSK